MNYIDEKVVLEFYLKELEEDKINFLRGHHKERVKERVEALLEGGSINKKIETAKNLWKALFEAAMSYIDPDKRGYDKIFSYFNEFVNFEELIFASDSFYRDHTLHSLWVYFLTQYINENEEFECLSRNKKKAQKRTEKFLKEIKIANRNDAFTPVVNHVEEINRTMDKNDAATCIAALSHDLGYPLKKIEKINKSIKNVLPYFSINNINEFNFKYTEVEQTYIDKFLNILSTDMGIEFNIENKELEKDKAFIEIMSNMFKYEDGGLAGVNIERANKLTDEQLDGIKNNFESIVINTLNSNKYLQYSRSFEDYKHGIMSAFLLVKNLRAFEDMNIKNSNAKLKLENVYYAQNLIKQQILIDITEHTNDAYRINNINNLTFIDELEEFSRISRANRNREYVEQFCHSKLFMQDNWFNIEFIFDNQNLSNLDPERAFKGRCERFLKLFDIPRLADNLKIRLKCIGKLQSNSNEYMLEIATKYARITINGEEQFIPRYLKSTEYYSREEYECM